MTRQLTDNERTRLEAMRDNAIATGDGERAIYCKRALAGELAAFDFLFPGDPAPISDSAPYLGALSPDPGLGDSVGGPLVFALQERFEAIEARQAKLEEFLERLVRQHAAGAALLEGFDGKLHDLNHRLLQVEDVVEETADEPDPDAGVFDSREN